MAKSCAHVVGVEMVHSAVKDAQANADENGANSAAFDPRACLQCVTELTGLKNTTFIAGRAEDVLSAAIAQHAQQVPSSSATQRFIRSIYNCSIQGKRTVAIVDPPREGLHPKVIQALRKCKGLDTLVYISCNHGERARRVTGPVVTVYTRSCMGRKHSGALRSELSEVPWNCEWREGTRLNLCFVSLSCCRYRSFQ
jgi:tRNA/tmRNA/rRNA uracil-C5-methylase (TrmA/RlmC/RlmD family)